jgi:GAF domain-containing protein
VQAAAIAHEDTTMVAGWRERFTTPLSRDRLHAAAILDAKLIDLPDAEAEKDGPLGPGVRNFLLSGNRAVTIMPMLRGRDAIGAISVTRAVPGPLSDKQIAILRTFADQAVIAIENVRLFNELEARNREVGEALERQTATAEILKVISESPTDTQPVFDAIAASARKLFGDAEVGITIIRGDAIELVAAAGMSEKRLGALRASFPRPLDLVSTVNTTVVDGRLIHYPDMLAEDVPAYTRDTVKSAGIRAMLGVPLLREGRSIGGVFLSRATPGAYTEQQIALLQTFADQAVIAIENVRLFNETKEALERQTATAEVLKVISESPTDVQPVFDAIATKALQLCAGDQGALFTFDGSMIHIGSLKVMSEEGADVLRAGFPMPPGRASASARAILTREVVHITDVYQDPDYLISDMAKAGNWRSIVSAPMLREGHPIGTITVARLRIQPFSDAEIALLRTFADQAVIAIENVRLFNETKEALERQTATSEILKVIASSPSDVQPVFDAIVKGAGRLSYPASVAISILEGEQLHLNSIHVGDSSTGGELAVARAIYPIPFDPERAPSARAILERRVIEIHDATQPDTPEFTRKAALAGHFLSATFVPLIREGRGIGSIIITHPEAGFRLSDKQLALMQTFADQAVIAIENVRLFNETREALERQTATAEILKVISESPTDVQPVFDAIARSAGRLFNCKAGISVREGDGVDLKAIADGSATEEEVKARFKEMKKAFPVPFDPERNLVSRAMATATAIEVADTEDAEAVSRIVRELGRAGGFRSIVNVPLVREGTGIGAIGLAFEQPGMRLNDRQRALVQTFADQAVIAIENVRLFKELEARNREVTETLERQTATAEILKVISESPTDIAPVFRTILANATTLSGSQFATLWMYEGGDAFRAVALHGTPPELTKWLMQGVHRFGPPFFRPEGPWRTGQVADVRDTVPYRRGDEIWIKCVELAHMRTMLMVPLIRDKRLLASIAIYRTEARPFTDQQIGLVSTFADQAVIAIENVRLFNETREALERQTATAEILKVISSSPTDMQPVFDAIVQSCVRLFGGITVALNIVRGDAIDRVAFSESPEARAATSGAFPMPLDDESLAGRAMLSGELLHVPDLSTESWIGERPRSIFRRMGYRSALCAPMIRERQAIGSIVVFRDFTGRFKDEQVALLKTFADQAVIAIENVRLFKELEERTNALTKSVGQLTALGEVSQTISSTLDLEKVLPTIVSRAVQLTGLDGGAIYEYDEEREVFNVRGGQNVRQELVELEREEPIRLGDGPIGRSAQMRQPVQAPDLTAGRRRTRGRDVLLQSGARALLAVPLLREGHILGALAVTRNTPGEFAPEVIALLETFAAQSAIAIQNARLFREIEQKSRELELASQHKSQFLASMSHELRTPLNAILGFNELILGGIYGEVPEDMNAPLAQMQSSGRHLLGLINNVLDLAKIEANRMELALADYSVHDVVGMVRSTLQSLATEKGLEFVVSAQEDLPLAHGDGGRLSQCLINLAGNAIKFTKQGRIEIRAELEGATFRFSVADTGMGIAPDKIDSLFTEFKQTDAAIASEYGGTGLGLAITKKFIEMHGGRIWVESELGEGSTFIFEIPLRVDTGAAA